MAMIRPAWRGKNRLHFCAGFVCVLVAMLPALAGCSGATGQPAAGPGMATPLPLSAPTEAPGSTASSTPFSLEVSLSVHALCSAPWKADALENACPQVLALYPSSSELATLSSLPPDRWPVYPAHVLAYDPATGCIYVREADGNVGWTTLSVVLDAAQIEIIIRSAPLWPG